MLGSTHRQLATALCFGLGVFSSTAPAQGEGRRHLRLELRYTQMRLSMADSTFHGHGYDSEKRYVEVEATGEELGLTALTVEWVDFVGDVVLPAGRGDVVFGPVFGVGWGTGQLPKASDDTHHFDTDALWGIRFGLEASYAIPLGFVAPRAGLAAGVRYLSMPLSDLKGRTCLKHDLETSTCGGRAAAADLGLEPTLGVDLFANPHSPVVFGIFASTDLAHIGAYSLGVGVGFRALR